jgi:putative hydrolase of the HAD superfamily
VIAAVLFDLDDTLYDQRQWLDGAWKAVAVRAGEWGAADPAALEAALRAAADDGTDRGGIIDNALVAVQARGVPVAPLVATFRAHQPARLDPYPGVAAALRTLADRVPLGLISDGDPVVQRAKLGALDLEPYFTTVVFSDEYGRAHRKPDRLPFQVALGALGVDPGDAVYVGDRPAKDIAGPAAVGMPAIRVRTGEWRDQPDDARAWASVDTVLDAIEILHIELPPATAVNADRATRAGSIS